MQTKSVLLLIFVLFLACNKNDDGEPSFPNNYFIAQRADITWQGSTEIVLTASDTLIFLAVGNGLDNGVLVAKIKFDGIGSYILNDLDGIYYNTLGGDVLISQYAIEDGSNGIFSISTYEEGNRYIDEITINPEIIKAPTKCIEYLIIHEMCHLIIPNHKKEFFNLLGQIMPNWRKWKQRLETSMI